MFAAPQGVDQTFVWWGALYATAMNMLSLRDLLPYLVLMGPAVAGFWLTGRLGWCGLGWVLAFVLGCRLVQSIRHTHGILSKSVGVLTLAMPKDSLRDYFDPARAPTWASATWSGALCYACGMSRPLSELTGAWPRMVTWTPKQQERFADVVTRATAEQRDWAEEQLAVMQEASNGDTQAERYANSTSIGNLAWMMRHGPRDLRPNYRQLLMQLCDGFRKMYEL